MSEGSGGLNNGEAQHHDENYHNHIQGSAGKGVSPVLSEI